MHTMALSNQEITVFSVIGSKIFDPFFTQINRDYFITFVYNREKGNDF